MEHINSILNEVVYVNIQTTNVNDSQKIILEAVKINEEYKSEELIIQESNDNKSSDIYKLKESFYNFSQGFSVIVNEDDIIKENKSVKEIISKNEILNLMEFAAVLEPWQKSFEYNYLINEITTIDENNKIIKNNNGYKVMIIVNSLLCRQWDREDSLVEKTTLYSKVKKLFGEVEKWKWGKYLLRPIVFSYDKYPYVLFEEKENNNYVICKKRINYMDYEKLLRQEELWNDGGKGNYQYRRDQEEISKKIRENIEKNKRLFIEAPTGSGKTFAYVLIAAIKTYLNKKEKSRENHSFVISTDTKELQNQLIEKDIPMIIKKLKLSNKVSYGAMKGKSNYICFDRLNKYTDILIDDTSKLTYLFLRRLSENGSYGDLENINYWASNYFNINKYISHINCDSEVCNLDTCRKPCYLRKRYNELQQEDITVINHSLLASWPYSEKKKIQHLILDEAHNLMDKSYDFFTEEFNSLEFIDLLNKIDKDNPSIIFLLDRLNGIFNYRVHIDKANIVKYRDNIIFNIITILNEISSKELREEEYNLNEEFFNAEYKNKEVMEYLQGKLSELKFSIYKLYKIINDYVEEIVEDEKELGNEYRSVTNYISKLKSSFDIIDNFITFSKDFAKIIEIEKNCKYFIIKNTPLEIGKLINETILKEVKSVSFLSATLKINNSFVDVKKILGQENANTFDISPVFNLKERTRIFCVKGLGTYRDGRNFNRKTAKFIYNLACNNEGHLLMLFNNNKRRDQVYEELNNLTRSSDIEVHISKKAIPLLKDKSKKVVILGSKGFFEGIDVPGDGLNCVLIDKIPNVNPKEPLFKALKAYRNTYYKAYNYPKVCIKMKQSYGRLVRSVLDYGYFILLDSGNNDITLKQLERDLSGPKIEEKWPEEIITCLNNDFNKWREENLKEILKNIKSENVISEFDEISERMNSFWHVNKDYTTKNTIVFQNKKNFIKLNLK